MAKIKQSMSGVQVVGTLKEINLSRTGVKKRELGKKGSGKFVECNSIGKTVYQNAAFTVDVNGSLVEVDIRFDINEKKLDKDGNIVDNADYKAFETMIDTYKCGETRIKVDGNVSPKEYVSKKDGKFHTYAPKITVFKVTSTNVPETDCVEGTVTGILRSHMPEVVNEEETGRIKAQIMSFDYTGNIYPIDLIVPAKGVDDEGEEFDLAEAFEEYFKTNDHVLLNVTAVTVQHGTTQKKSVGIGRSSKRTTGYTTQELQVVGGSVIVTDTDDDEYDANLAEYLVSTEDVKTALENRDKMIVEKEMEKSASAPAPTASVKGSASSVAPQSLPF